MEQIEPGHYINKKECQEMIDDAIRRHNRNASIISNVCWLVRSCSFCRRSLETYWSYTTSIPMAQHYPEIIGILFLSVFAVTMFYHGHMNIA